MRSKCEECRRVGFECELDCYPCSNCVERGFSDVRPERQAPPSESLKEGSQQPLTAVRCIRYLQTLVSAFCASFLHIYHSTTTAIFLRYLYLPILLFLPIYYFSRASTVIESAERCKEEYDEWIGIRPRGTSIVNSDATISSNTLTSDLELQIHPTAVVPAHAEHNRATLESIRVPPPYSSVPVPSSPLVRAPPPPSVVKLKEDWTRYIDSRIVEWRIAATTACVFVAASPTIFQIPDASNDPFTRSIAFLALCRALSGIIYGPIFPIYFRGSRSKTAHFAMLWSQEAKKAEKSMFWGPWVMLSLPGVATCWATIFFLLAIFSFIWRTGSTADPSDWPDAPPGRPPMSVDLALVLRIVITSITVVDLGCMIWIWRVLRSLDKKVWRDKDGGDGFPVSPGFGRRNGGRVGDLTP